MNGNISFFGVMNPLAIIFALFFILSIIMGTYVYSKNAGLRTARIFLALSISIAFVHLGEVFFSWSPWKPDAYFAHALSSIGFVVWWPLSINLFLSIRDKTISMPWKIFLGLNYFFSAVHTVTVFSGYSASLDYVRAGFSWVDVPNWSPVGLIYLGLMPVWIICIIGLLLSIYRKALKTSNVVMRKQFNFIAGVGIPMIFLGVFFNIVAPGLHLGIPVIGHLFLGMWILAMGWAIAKYRFLVPTLEFASKEIISIAGEIIVITDLNWDIMEFNEAFMQKVGYRHNERIGMKDLMPDFTLDIQESGGIRRIADAEVTLRKKDGSFMYAKRKGSYLYDNGLVIGVVFVLSDITELKHRNEELESKVKERTLELAEAKEEAERRLRITQVYTRRSIVDIIQDGKDPRHFQAENRKVNILFSDIRDFTRHAESLSPLETVKFLNVYFESMNECVMNCNGEIDKLIGDCIMAIFTSSEDAVSCAIQMRRNLVALNETSTLKYRLNNGIGMNFGDVTVGNIGSQSKMDWTVIGDIVNSASRLESLTKVYGLPIITSEDFASSLSQGHDVRFIDHVLVKGKKTPFRIFEVYDHEHQGIKDLKVANQSLMDEAYALYSAGFFQEAAEKYQVLKERFGPHRYMQDRCADPALDFFLDRCTKLEKLREKGLLEEWNGIYEFMEK